MADTSAYGPTLPERDNRRQVLIMFLVTLVIAGYMVAWAIGTQPIIGDEARHFRRAMNCYDMPLTQMRVTHDPAYPFEEQGAVLYWDACLWHLGLAMLWKILGNPSMLAAQLYHSLYFVAMALAVYLAGRELYGHRGGLWAWALVVTTPMNLLFGMAFYMEIPVMAFTALAVFLLIHGRPILFGGALAGMFLTKSTSGFVLIPPLLCVALLTMDTTWHERIARATGTGFTALRNLVSLTMSGNWKRRILRTAAAAAVAGVIVLPDLIWRKIHFEHPVMFRQTSVPATEIPAAVHSDLARMPEPQQSAVPLSIFNPLTVLRMFGVSGVVAVVLAVIMALDGAARAAWDSLRNLRSGGLLAAVLRVPDTYPIHALIFGLPLLVYLVAYAVMMRKAYDVRYLQPITLFASLMAAGWLIREPLVVVYRLHRWLGRLVVIGLAAAMIAQLIAVPPMIRRHRMLPEEIRTAYEWIRTDTAPESRFFYLEENLTTLTGRPIYWAAALPRYLFNSKEQRQMDVLSALKIDYIAIHPTRRDAGVGKLIEPSNYPIPWIESLADRPYLSLVYPENFDGNIKGKFLIYHIERDKIPREWKTAEAVRRLDRQ